MARNISLWGALYPDVPYITLPTDNGSARFYDDVGSEIVTQNGTYDVKGLAEMVVNVSGGSGGASQTIRCGMDAPSSSVGDDGDVYIQMASGGTLEVYPADYTSHNMNSSSHLSDCIGVSAEDGTSTSNVYSSGSSVTGTADYIFDLSSIPSNATITSVALEVKAHEENASRSTCTVQLFADSTAKGSVTTVNGTSNTIYTVDCGSWTRSELDSLVMRLSLGYYGGLIAGATLTVTYEADSQYSVTLTGDNNSWALNGDNIYKKQNGSWIKVSSVELNDSIKR
jgi:hypothetical protein